MPDSYVAQMKHRSCRIPDSVATLSRIKERAPLAGNVRDLRRLGGEAVARTAALQIRATSMTKAYEKPLAVEIFDGEVVLRATDGPFSASLTAAAAAKTAEDLAEAARTAFACQTSQVRTVRD